MKKLVLSCLLLGLFVVPTWGLAKHENYIAKDDVSGWMYNYYPSWVPGNAPTGGSENENFFIGRVRPLKRFTNKETQVIQDGDAQVTRRMNRRLLWWCPINESEWTSLPRYAFDSEAFSNWSYVTTHGNWTQGFLRQPGAFADVCHKNGVLTAVVSAAPWAVTLTATDGSHGQNYQSLISGGADKLLKLMAYYGIDGLGFNSEQSWGMRDGMKNLIQQCHAKKATYGMQDRLHFDFYQLSDALGDGGGGTDFSDFFPSANGFFLNYNWSASKLQSSVANANAAGGNTFDIYAGMDMQGRNYASWTTLNGYDVSIGIWGAHNKCMPYEGATEDGSTPKAIQTCYLRKCEQLFTGGTRNPVSDKAINNVLCNGNASFFGVSKLMAAKSALSWKENPYFPFISYMNLGNGEFFNNEGKTTYNDEWYNIGMQDHLPTWRWWITTKYMGRNKADVPNDTHATFTYEDAWFGGSCLKISFDNTTIDGTRYIQLYKTQFPVNTGGTYKLRVRYKVLKGSAMMFYTMSNEGSENDEKNIRMGVMNTEKGAIWQVMEKNVPTAVTTMAQLGMKFTTIAAGTEILIGEVALVKDGVTYTPVKPTITDSKTQVFRTTSRGVDFKVIWECAKPAAQTAPAKAQMADVVRAATMQCTYSGNASHASRFLRKVTITGNNGCNFQSPNLQTAIGQAVYFDKRDDNSSIEAKPGETITVNFDFSGEWMHGYVYVDYNNNGTYEADEIVAYSFKNDDYTPGGEGPDTGVNSAGVTLTGSQRNVVNPPAFQLPSTLAQGTYTLRVKVDWCDTNPCGSDYTASNGGCIADFVLKVSNGGGTGTGGGEPQTENWTPTYNDEIDTWYFEIYAQQEGKTEQQLVTTTTSWAAYAVEVPFDISADATKRVRVGVRSVAPDGTTKSAIAWSDYMDASNITIIEGFSVDKPVIKPNEEFTIAFDDVNHSAAKSFKVYKAKDNSLVNTYNNVKEFTATLNEIGLYDVEATYTTQAGATTTEMKRGMIQVSSDEVGAMPIIYTLTTDKEAQSNEITKDEVVTLSYTGRPADGTTSRALRLQEKPFCVSIAQLYNAINNAYNFTNTPITISFWFNPLQFIDAGDAGGNSGFGDQGTQMLNIRNPTASWPTSDWGYLWSGIHNGGNDYWANILKAGQAAGVNYTTMTNDFVIPTANWTHIAISITGTSVTNKGIELYVNGRKVDDRVQNAGTVAEVSRNDYIYMGGTAAGRAAFDGLLDEFQIWKKSFTATTINEAMAHYNAGEVPADLIAYWDFEDDPTTDNRMVSRGTLGDAIFAVVGNSWRCVQGEGDGVTGGSDPMVASNRMAPVYGVGTPFLAGRYEVKTTPSWIFTGPATGGEVLATDNGEAGSTTASWSSMADAPYIATLKLTNSWGSDTKSVTLIDACVKLDEVGDVVEDLTVYPNPFVESVHVRFVEAGNYEMEIFSITGQLLQAKQLSVFNNEVVGVNLSGEAGSYLVRLKRDGKVIKSFKLQKK